MLTELVTLSDELARLKGKPPASPETLPWNYELHADLASVLSSGAFALKRQGVDVNRLTEFTENARSRGMRRKAIVFGWHPEGLTWFATPEDQRGDAKVLVIHRRKKMDTDELTVEQFVSLCIEDTRAAIEAATAPEPEPEPEPDPAGHFRDVVVEIKPKVKRVAKVELPESNGATVVADGLTDEFTGPELGYLRWCMTELLLTTEEAAPDLSRWEARCLRMCKLDEIPAPTDPARALWDETWARLTSRDRAAPGPVSHQIPTWKFAEPGSWILAPKELEALRRAVLATPPRHTPDEEQAALWARWMALVATESVELHVH